MKKLCTILIGLLFFAYQGANYIVFTLVKDLEKEKLEAKILMELPESECEIINLANRSGNYHWEKPGSIFILDGEMYDVSKKKIVNGNVYFYCIKETKEMEILDDLTLQISTSCEGNMAYALSTTDDFIMTGFIMLAALPPAPRIIGTPTLSMPVDRPSDILVPPPRPRV